MLNDRQIKFIDAYIEKGIATQAAIIAGYSEKTAYSIGDRLLKNVEISEEIKRKKELYAKGAEVDAIWMNTRLRQMVERCMTAEPVMIKNEHGEWVESGEYQFDSSGANKALEMLAKRTGFFELDNKQKGIKFKVSVGK